MILSIFVLGYVLNTVRRARGTETCKMIFGKILCTVFSSSILTFTPTVLFHEVCGKFQVGLSTINPLFPTNQFTTRPLIRLYYILFLILLLMCCDPLHLICIECLMCVCVFALWASQQTHQTVCMRDGCSAVARRPVEVCVCVCACLSVRILLKEIWQLQTSFSPL